MDLSRPFAVVTPTLDGEVLAVLAGADTEFTSGDVLRLLGDRSSRGVRLVLDRLADQGIVTRRSVGRAWLYTLNREHVAADAVLALAGLRASFLRRLAIAVSEWPDPPLFDALFGSAATRGHTAGSDIDVFLVRPEGVDEDEWESLVTHLVAAATRWTGNDTRPLVLSESEVSAWVAHGEPVVADVAEHGITFYGDPGWLRARTHRDKYNNATN